MSKIELVVTDAGDWVFGAGRAPCRHAQPEVGRDPRRTDATRRAVIQAAADAYLDNWGDPALPVPHGTPCARSRPHKHRQPEPAAIPATWGRSRRSSRWANRRYVIDETIGAVVIFHNFPWIDAGLPTDPGNAGQPDVSRRGRQEPRHPRGDCLHDAEMREG